ncbi:MAG: prepilin-type N-terminal cleavage/methylation domain-containing protein [Campylobacterales bacterium]|nr:prepilin-type N-terminal cleavage/methylation domain-containing protein [Campylobacterales bacterium]
MKTLRQGFTLIEVLISVVIISVSIIFVMKLHNDNYNEAIYISERNKLALEDSLFLTPSVARYHKDTKDAYTLLHDNFKIEEDKSRQLLKKKERDINIPEPIEIILPPAAGGYTVTVDRVLLRGNHSSEYFRIKF